MPAAILTNVLAWSAQVAVLVVVCAPLPRVLRLPAHVEYGFWRVVLALSLALPFIQPWHPIVLPPPPAPIDVSGALGRVMPMPAEQSSAAGAAWLGLTLIALVGGAVLRMAWVAIGWFRLRRMRTMGTRVAEESAAAEVSELASTIGARADVRWTCELPQPVTFGLRHPVVLLPGSLRARPSNIRRAVIAHELFHVQRRDSLMVLIEECVRAGTWFHPAMWWLISRVRLAREGVVDELTVMLTGSRQTYLDALLLLADEGPLASSAFSRRRQLFHRIRLISREVRMTSQRFVAACGALALALVVTGWTAVAAFPLQKIETVSAAQMSSARAVNFSLKNADIRSVLRMFSEVSGFTVNVDPRVKGTVDLEMPNVPWGTALDAILQAHHLASRVEGTMLFVFPSESAGQSPAQPRDIYRNPPPPPPPPQQWKSADAANAVRIGGGIKQPMKIHDVKPVYPAAAQAYRVQGVVIVEALLGRQGNIEEVHILRSIPMLDDAAVDAVSQWKFQPVLLNGEPVPAIMTLTVNFTVQQ